MSNILEEANIFKLAEGKGKGQSQSDSYLFTLFIYNAKKTENPMKRYSQVS